MSCHYLCTIGPQAPHHGSQEYRCVDEYGYTLPFLDDGEVVDPDEQHHEAVRQQLIDNINRRTT